MFRNITINILFVDALLKILEYAKFMKELVTKNKNLEFETIEVSNHCSAIMSSNLLAKKKDLEAFTILCRISVNNLMSLVIFKQLDLGALS